MRFEAAVLLVVLSTAVVVAQQPQRTPPPSTLRAPTRAEILRGEYGRYRANNDLLHYDLDVRVDPEKKLICGKNTIRFKMLKDDTRIQLELFANYTIEKIVMGAQTLKYERDHNTVYVDFPETLRADAPTRSSFTTPASRTRQGRFGALAFKKDPAGKHWINTANEGEGSASWWPSKDQWRDEPEGIDIRVAVPERPRQRVERALHRARPISATATRVALSRALPDQLLQRVAEHRQLRALRRDAWAI